MITTITFEEGDHYSLEGATSETGEKIKDGYDEIFGIDVKKITEGPAVFSQLIKVTDNTKSIAGDLQFMTCDDKREGNTAHHHKS